MLQSGPETPCARRPAAPQEAQPFAGESENAKKDGRRSFDPVQQTRGSNRLSIVADSQSESPSYKRRAPGSAHRLLLEWFESPAATEPTMSTLGRSEPCPHIWSP